MYMETSGEGITDKTSRIMRPSQAENDAAVMHRIQKWIDDQKDLESLGVEPLGVRYRVTGLKDICTPARGRRA